MNDKTRMAVLQERFELWMKNTDEYRVMTQKKLDRIQEKSEELGEKIEEAVKSVLRLPCESRKHWYTSMSKQVAFMWIVLTSLLLVAAKHVWSGMNGH